MANGAARGTTHSVLHGNPCGNPEITVVPICKHSSTLCGSTSNHDDISVCGYVMMMMMTMMMMMMMMMIMMMQASAAGDGKPNSVHMSKVEHHEVVCPHIGPVNVFIQVGGHS